MARPSSALLAAGAAVFCLLGSMSTLGESDAAGCPVVDQPLLGRSCEVPGGFRVFLADGSWVFTHGLDPPPDGAFAYDLPLAPTAAGTTAACAVTDDEPQGSIVYAVPSDRADRFTTMRPQIQAMWQDAAARLWYTGLERGTAMRYRMHCDLLQAPFGLPSVAGIRLSTTTAQTNLGTVISDLQAAGLNHPFTKYWTWVDVGFFGGGVGTMAIDDQPYVINHNNIGGAAYAATWGHTGSSGAQVMMHEDGHNLGAVQLSAPHTSGGLHCNDGWDIMCYADGGPSSNYNPNVCSQNPPPGPPGPRFDCNGDDYFNPNPPQGSYLASHWNLGSIHNIYLAPGVTGT